MTNKITDMVSNGKLVTFTRYKMGELWYITECGFEFPVPVSDTGDATFLNQDKAMLFMRYIRKHLVAIEQARATQEILNGNFDELSLDEDDKE
jgi:hypothetical protein